MAKLDDVEATAPSIRELTVRGVVLGGVIVIAAFYVLVNMTVDVAYALIDPRIRRG